nr:hypothetical protein Iba_chr01dCG3920 [Ipomoea batatas]
MHGTIAQLRRTRTGKPKPSPPPCHLRLFSDDSEPTSANSLRSSYDEALDGHMLNIITEPKERVEDRGNTQNRDIPPLTSGNPGGHDTTPYRGSRQGSASHLPLAHPPGAKRPKGGWTQANLEGRRAWQTWSPSGQQSRERRQQSQALGCPPWWTPSCGDFVEPALDPEGRTEARHAVRVTGWAPLGGPSCCSGSCRLRGPRGHSQLRHSSLKRARTSKLYTKQSTYRTKQAK